MTFPNRFLFLGVLFQMFLGTPLTSQASTKTIHLEKPTLIGGIPVAAGDVEVFEPNGELQHGFLNSDFSVQDLPLLRGSELIFVEPSLLSSVQLPTGKVTWVHGVPLRSGTSLKFTYTKYWEQMTALLTENPIQLSGFQSGGVATGAFENDTFSHFKRFRSQVPPISKWHNTLSLTLAKPVTQNFGTRNVELPRGSTLSFYGKWGISTIQLAQDTLLIDLPVSASKPIRVNRWTTEGAQAIVGVTLSKDANYLGLPLPRGSEVELYDADHNGEIAVAAFVPSVDVAIPAANQTVIVAAQNRSYLNRDGSLRYGRLAKAQEIQGLLFPEKALTFFGNTQNSPVRSVGLFKQTRMTVNGITYINDIGEGTLFLDFDNYGHVVRVRKVNPN